MSATGPICTTQQVQQCALSRSGWPDHHDELADLDRQIGIDQRINAHPMAIGSMPDTNTLFITTIDIYRVIFRAVADKEHKRILD